MAGRNGKKKAAAGLGLIGTGASVFFAAAALATGSAVTAAPARADFDALIDPIIQPILASFTDSLALFDPAAAVDLTNWADTFLSSLNSTFDSLLPSLDSAAAASSTGALPTVDALTGGTLGLSLLEGTEPAVKATIDGGTSVPLLVDTGSSGLVIPYTDLGSNYFSQIEALFSLGTPTGISESGYSGGVDYLYLTYSHVPVDYLGADGATALSTDGPVNVEIYSWDPSNIFSYFSNDAFQNFLSGNEVDGILGIGENTAGPTTTPFLDYGGVYVNIPGGELVVGGGNPIPDAFSTSGDPVSKVLESVNGGTAVTVTNNIDSGGVFGTIPSSLATNGSIAPGTEITVTNTAGQELYSYTVGTTNVSDTATPHFISNAPTVISGTSIDSGVLPFLTHGVYLDYAADKTYFEPLT
ncbi:PecA family PE domain-processing aspartic protease [Candidatus Mycobacterium wuenschmannii]|uniref:PecA family PE domain-processing aspartic protease n=1 Tax=Candidatus Mycobacterium wuenschmannii TaxID=3027808 RepID=A0ABY8W4E9_9MYCO|nr:PecA family PE domain-processing aspartic protease [Candidatus Mycobacterium wuenschmannii]WIM88644.1 PecA family PE domain-processing aspartic protease [Candidatus Mycobacterium wuenschmannii]